MSDSHEITTVRCMAYEGCQASVRRALELSGLGSSLAGRHVLLKPNMMKGSPPERAEATNPLFVGALTRILVESGCTVTVGDSTGILGFTEEVFDASGMRAAVEAAGGRIINFDAGPFIEIDLGGRFAGARRPVARSLVEMDAVLSVPKLKTHTFLGLTLSVKNLIGVFPGAVKCGLHTLAPAREDFAALVAGLPAALEAAGVNIAGAVVDGILALGGRGGVVPPQPKWAGFIAAGTNLFDVDLGCAVLGGFEPESIPVWRHGASAGKGAVRQGELVAVGDRIEPVTLAHPGADLIESSAPLTAAYYRVRGNVVRPDFDHRLCIDCNKCFEVCPAGCIIVDGPRDRKITSACTRCLACREVCPTGAMGLAANPILKPFLKERAAGLAMKRLR